MVFPSYLFSIFKSFFYVTPYHAFTLKGKKKRKEKKKPQPFCRMETFLPGAFIYPHPVHKSTRHQTPPRGSQPTRQPHHFPPNPSRQNLSLKSIFFVTAMERVVERESRV